MPLPVIVESLGNAVTVHVPEAGNPLKSTLPVAKVQVGCVTVPVIGAVGVVGCAFTVALVEADEVQPTLFVTVNI